MQNVNTVSQLLKAFEDANSIDEMNSKPSLRASYRFLQQRASENPSEVLNEKEARHFLHLFNKEAVA